MLRFLKWMMPAVVAVGFMMGASAVQADDITGTVVDKDGKPVAELRVTLNKPRERGQGQQGQRPEPLATATTDKDGKFTLAIEKDKVADGDYVVSAMQREPRLFARQAVKVAAGKADPAKVELKLAEMQRRQPAN